MVASPERADGGLLDGARSFPGDGPRRLRVVTAAEPARRPTIWFLDLLGFAALAVLYAVVATRGQLSGVLHRSATIAAVVRGLIHRNGDLLAHAVAALAVTLAVLAVFFAAKRVLTRHRYTGIN